MFLTILLILFLALLGYLLVAPVEIVVNTRSNEYYARLGGIVKASIEAHEKEILRIKMKIYFLKFYFYPLKIRRKKTLKTGDNKRGKRINFRRGIRVLKSFKIEQFRLDMDTGDVVSNAKLFPLCTLLKYNGGNFNINFQGKNELAIHLKNRPINIIKLFINT